MSNFYEVCNKYFDVTLAKFRLCKIDLKQEVGLSN